MHGPSVRFSISEQLAPLSLRIVLCPPIGLPLVERTGVFISLIHCRLIVYSRQEKASGRAASLEHRLLSIKVRMLGKSDGGSAFEQF